MGCEVHGLILAVGDVAPIGFLGLTEFTVQADATSLMMMPVTPATISKRTIMATGPYWFLSATAVPKKPSREMASAKESTSEN